MNINIDAKLGVNTYKVDKVSHIKIDEKKCKLCKDKICLYICPAKVYTLQNDKIVVSYEGCIECGTCRIVCEFIDWKYPKDGCGIQFKYG